MRNDIIELEEVSYNTDEEGDTTKITTYREVFAEKLSISMSEFYQAHTIGLKPQYKFKIHPSEYNNELKIKYNGNIYKVLRTYGKDSETLEIIVEGDIHECT